MPIIGQTEQQHNTPEQVRRYLDEALRIVAELELDDELRVVAFTKAIDLLAAKQIFYEQMQPTMTIPRNHGLG